jgi:hypothetical protein
MPLSFQPIFGGPAYAIRNLVINAAVEQAKLHNATVGVLMINNSFVGAAYAMQVLDNTTPHELVVENNIWMGPSPAPGGRTVNWDQPLDPATYTVDYNGWYPDGQFHFGTGTTGHNYASFAGVQAGGVYEAHGRVLGASIFASGLAAPSSYTVSVTPVDGTLATGSDAIDHGTTIPNVTDGFHGAAPDLGAQETGCAVPIYGVRPEGVDESNEPLGCTGPVDGGDGGAGAGGDAQALDGGAADGGGVDGAGADGAGADGAGSGNGHNGGASGAASGSKSGCACRATAPGGRPDGATMTALLAVLLVSASRRTHRRRRPATVA